MSGWLGGHARVRRREVLAPVLPGRARGVLLLSVLARPARCLPSLSISKRRAPAKGAASTSFTVTEVAELIGLAGARADQRVMGLVIAEIIVAERAGGNEAVGAGVGELDEQPGVGGAGDAALETGADLFGEEGRDQAVGGLALGGHGAALGGGNARGDFGQLFAAHLGQAAGAEVQRAHQRAMHDQIGVAADRRGEMRVAAQMQAEMAVILRDIFRLRLGAQHDLVDDVLVLGAAHLRENIVELHRLDHLALGELDADGRQKLRQRVELLDRGLVMGAIDQVRLLGFQRLGGGDIGEDHEFLDHLMGVEARRGHTRSTVLSAFSRILRSGRSRSSGDLFSRAIFVAS